MDYPKINVCFTPQENCAEQIIDAINQSKKSILVQAFKFTYIPIATSLIQAKDRGIDVKVILDKSEIDSKYSVIKKLFEANIHILIDYKPAIAHNKLMIIDNKTVVTGSFNFTYSAQEKNTENLLIIQNNDPLIEKYLKNWYDRQSQSRPYVLQPQR